MRNLGTMKVVYLVTVSESSGASSLGCTGKRPLNGCCMVLSEENEVHSTKMHNALVNKLHNKRVWRTKKCDLLLITVEDSGHRPTSASVCVM